MTSSLRHRRHGLDARFPRRLAAFACILLVTALPVAGATPGPVCPGAAGAPVPAPAARGEPPTVESWRDLSTLPTGCHVTLETEAALVVALAGRFTHAGPIEALAERLGAISTTAGMPYWSVTDRAWKPLVGGASALGSADAKDTRVDFTAREILGGDTLHFAQNDSRSWGMNVFRLRVIDARPERLVATTDNLSPVRLGPLTLFAPHAVTSVLFVEALDGAEWAYYSLAVIRDSAFAARERSLINRQDALYRLFVGEEPDGRGPLAP